MPQASPAASPPDDERSQLAAAARDPEAREAVVARWSPLVWALCRRLSPQPEDSYQAAWAHLLTRLDAYDPEQAAPSTWLTTVVHRHLVDEHRRRGRRGRVVPLGEGPVTQPDPGAALDRHRRREALEEALARLPEATRRVVVLHHIHGLPLAEIAASEDVAVGTVKSRLHRGRARLAVLLGSPS